ncbi:MAG: phosphoglycerate dehydrogenase [Acidobacteriia bacterium]|nr:phosphoglycerate dehydrogenase [Terriglobia bacterium]
MKIVIAEKVAANAVRVLKEEKEWTVITHEQINGNLDNALPDADALIVRSAVDVNANMLRNAVRLQVIGRAGVGVDNIDLEAATNAGIAVMNTPGANAVAVAEHTLALMLALSRHITRADSTTKAGKWEKKSLQGTELRGKVLGIVGMGRIGIEVAKRAKAFDMEVVAHDPYVPYSLAAQHGVNLLDLDEVFATADYLSLHVGLTPQTANMINEQSLAKMKRGVRIINCARGELIDDAALAVAITSKHVAGAALDVFVEEPPRNLPLLELENVIVTPHIAGSTNEAQDAVGIQIVSQVREFLKRGVVLNAVNLPSLGFEQNAEMQPYIELARSLGKFLAKTAPGQIEEVSIQCGEKFFDGKTDLICSAVLQGILAQIGEKANMVNAAAKARERCIRLAGSGTDQFSDKTGKDIITVMLKTASGDHCASGTIFHGAFRLLSVNGMDIEAPLQGNMICVRHAGATAMIGKLGNALACQGIGINHFACGRSGLSGSEAISILQADRQVTESTLQEIAELEEVHSACSVQF